ncbi:MAG TPA: metalloregulator ArsR/SmtB family transcription factor [Vicinamibacterales bacterium]|nr:metalloregulator ArsR/SmtB family transcription factor [Vicinamibacterales bacterium]
MQSASALFRLLGDEARLRMLRLLSAERLNVSELTAVLGIAQSGVSRHLGLLKESGLVVEQREGGYSYYRAAREDSNGLQPVWDLLDRQFRDSARDPVVLADQARLKEVLRLRKESFAVHGGERRQLVPGRSWAAWARVLGFLLPPLRVADLGCGDGYLTIEAARWASRVIAVDRSKEVLTRARGLAKRRGVDNIIWKQGDIEHLPIPDRSVDVVLLSQALHHAVDPARALAEAVRILVPDGRVLVLDLRRHDQQWVRERLGDRWLGFDDEELRRLLEGAGLSRVQVRVGAKLTGDPFTVLIAAGTLAGARSRDAGCGMRERSAATRGNGKGRKRKTA